MTIRRDFVQFVAALGRGKWNDEYWSLSSLASRDIYLSPLFERCCKLAFVKHALENSDRPLNVRTRDPALARALRRYAMKYGSLVVASRVSLGRRIANRLCSIRHWAISTFLISQRMLARKPDQAKRLLESHERITLLDTFVLNSSGAGSIQQGDYSDRYYTGLTSIVSDNVRSELIYLPTFIGFKDMFEAFKKARTSKARFLLVDDLLRPRDYLSTIFYAPLRRLFHRFPNLEFLDFDTRDIVRDEQRGKCAHHSVQQATLNLKFARRLAKYRNRIRCLVEWNENQVIDKGLILGFSRFLPDSKVVAYKSYPIAESYLMHLSPTKEERLHSLSPAEVAVIGKGYIKTAKEFDPDLKVITAPALRFQYIWSEKRPRANQSQISILVALPIPEYENLAILEVLQDSLRRFNKDNAKQEIAFRLKPHPTHNKKYIRSLLKGSWPPAFEVIEGDILSAYDQSDIFISNTSSACIEAIARGIPTIVIGEHSGMTQCPIPEDVPKDIWSLCYTKDEVIASITQFVSKKRTSRSQATTHTHRDLLNRYFEPVTKEAVYKLLSLEQPPTDPVHANADESTTA